MKTGTIKWFSEKKGYGFILPDDGSNELFVHHSKIQSQGRVSLEKGQKVEYETGTGEKGRPCAVNVRPC